MLLYLNSILLTLVTVIMRHVEPSREKKEKQAEDTKARIVQNRMKD